LKHLFENRLTLSIKDFRSQGVEGLSSADILQTRGEGVLQMWTSALLGAKTSEFSKFMGCPHAQGGWGLRQCGHFTDKRGQLFAIWWGRPLWTAPFKNTFLGHNISVEIW